ncbi:MAG: hypothetical protein CVV42_14920 [Candidatus Riflebacteria bacterium HGW-Riflebacteria-2]|jgi:hypothetical protein|nr:MAG: hypothetical protein CVV42_14920 [Candidatus Riflebacteria bacterium HGW-Riflebacteria-2]
MRRIAAWVVITLVFLLFLFGLSGFKTVDKSVIEIVGCSLSGNDAYFKVFPKEYVPGLVTLNVKIFDDRGIAALGSRKIEILHMPAEGLSFRVPLTGNLSSHKTYRVVVDLPGNETHTATITWPDMAVAANNSAQFFSRNFNPISEPVEMRNQINVDVAGNNLR